MKEVVLSETIPRCTVKVSFTDERTRQRCISERSVHHLRDLCTSAPFTSSPFAVLCIFIRKCKAPCCCKRATGSLVLVNTKALLILKISTFVHCSSRFVLDTGVFRCHVRGWQSSQAVPRGGKQGRVCICERVGGQPAGSALYYPCVAAGSNKEDHWCVVAVCSVLLRKPLNYLVCSNCCWSPGHYLQTLLQCEDLMLSLIQPL